MPGHGGRHRDPLLVLDLELRAERAEQRPRLVALVGGRRGRRVPDGHAVADAGRRVGHRADDLVVAERRDERVGRRARRGPTARAGRGAAAGPISRPTRASICGLTARMTTSARGDRLDVRGDGPDAVRRRERLAPLGARVAGHELGRRRRGCRAAGPRSSPRPSRRSRRSRSCGSSRGDIAPEDSTGSLRAPTARPRVRDAALSPPRPRRARRSARSSCARARGTPPAGATPP